MRSSVMRVVLSAVALLYSGGALSQAICTTIVPGEVTHQGGNAYHVYKNFGFPGDTKQTPSRSKLTLLENGVAIGPAHTVHKKILAFGLGRYSHWGNGLYFSSSDNTDPRTNGRQYSISGPCRLVKQFVLRNLAVTNLGYATFQSHNQKVAHNAYGIFAVYSDTATTEAEQARQRWTLVRSADGGQSFQIVARGANSVRPPTLETDEDGNIYLFDSKVNACDPPLPPSQMFHESGNAFVTVQNFGFAGDTNEQPTRSVLRLLEDGLEIGPSHTQHATIRSAGGGAYSHWYNTLYNTLYFSSSDNTDPRYNGRRYTLTTLSEGCLHNPITPGEIFHEQGLAYIVPRQFGFDGDTSDCPTCPTRSNLRLFENGVEIGPAHTQHQTIRDQGRGAFSHWHNQLYFSASDNTNPATNLRTYAYTGGAPSALTGGTPNEAALYQFGPTNNFTRPLWVRYIPQGSAGKFTSFYDRTWGRLYYGTWWNVPYPTLVTLDRDGNLLSSSALTVAGPNAAVQYPHVAADGANVYLAWTNQGSSPGFRSSGWYRGINAIRSTDGGVSWANLAGQAVSLPIVSDDTGPSTMISLADELNTSTWLSSLALRDRKLHFFYSANPVARVSDSFQPRQHYVRFNQDVGYVDRNIYPRWRGLNSGVYGLDGFFAQKRGGALLYAVAAKESEGDNRILVLESDDNGITWIEHAVSEPVPAAYGIYAIGGFRWITDDGYLIGTFTQYNWTGLGHIVKVFRVRVR